MNRPEFDILILFFLLVFLLFGCASGPYVRITTANKAYTGPIECSRDIDQLMNRNGFVLAGRYFHAQDVTSLTVYGCNK